MRLASVKLKGEEVKRECMQGMMEEPSIAWETVNQENAYVFTKFKEKMAGVVGHVAGTNVVKTEGKEESL